MTRKALHTWIDRCLDAWGFEDEIAQPFGSILFRLQFQDGKINFKEKERRETEK